MKTTDEIIYGKEEQIMTKKCYSEEEIQKVLEDCKSYTNTYYFSDKLISRNEILKKLFGDEK